MSPVTIVEAAEMIRLRRITSVELVTECLQTLRSTDTDLNAYITECGPSALEAAHAADVLLESGCDLGPLHGVPISVKDNIDVAGFPATAGSRILSQQIPVKDAAVVRKLRQSGAIIVGKTNMHEFAMGATTENPHFGTTRNPWDRTRFVSGSSGGSAAAVSSGSCLASVGTDTAGSVRLPAAMTGVVGLRPTFGRISTAGVFPVARSVDTVGPITRSVDDLALMLQAMAGFDLNDRLSSDRIVPNFSPRSEDQGLEGIRIGVLREYATTRLGFGVGETFTTALQDLSSLGARIIDIEPPDSFQQFSKWNTVRRAETAAIHKHWINSRAGEYGNDVREVIFSSQGITATEYIRAQHIRECVTRDFLRLFERVDVIATPTSPFTAIPIGQDWVELDGAIVTPAISEATRYTNLASCIGSPALSIPAGFVKGLPVGIQLIAGPFEELTLLRIGREYEVVNNWNTMQPEK